MPGKTDLTELLLDGRMHAIGEGRYMFGPWIDTVYMDYFRSIWAEASPTTIETRSCSQRYERAVALRSRRPGSFWSI
jgi:hypothetical protein